MLTQFFSNEKLVTNEHKQYFNISHKEKMAFELKRHESNIIKEASENIKRNISKLGK